MKNFSVKHLSIIDLVLTATSVVTAVIVPNESNMRRANDGTLRINSATAAGADQDAGAGVVSCIPEIETVMSCTATDSCTTTNERVNSCEGIFPFYYQTQGNTSQTGAQTGFQTSISILC